MSPAENAPGCAAAGSAATRAPVVAIESEADGKWMDASAAVRACSDFARVRVRYEGGLTVWADGSGHPWQVEDTPLPPKGWLARGPDASLTPRDASTAKTRILDTAQRIVGAKGFSAVGLNEILAAADVPKGSFYYSFASEEAFGTTLLEHYFTGYLSETEEYLSAPGQSARARLVACWTFWREKQEGGDSEGKCLAVKLGAEVSDMSVVLHAPCYDHLSVMAAVTMEGAL